MLEYDSENLNSEEVYSSLRGVTEAIQNFSFRSQEDLMEPLRRDGKRDGVVRVKTDAISAPPFTFHSCAVLFSARRRGVLGLRRGGGGRAHSSG